MPPKDTALQVRATVEMKDYLKRDGSVYNGKMRKKEYSQYLYISHGFGEQKFPDGSNFAGDWKNGICHG